MSTPPQRPDEPGDPEPTPAPPRRTPPHVAEPLFTDAPAEGEVAATTGSQRAPAPNSALIGAAIAVVALVVLFAVALSQCGGGSETSGATTDLPADSGPTSAAPSVDGGADAEAVRAAMDAPLMPESGVLIGGYISAQTSHVDANRRQDVIDYESAIQRPLDIAHDFYPPHQEWLVDRHNWHIDSGRIPMITWRVGSNADAFLRGEYDEEVRVRARQANEIKGLFFSRFFHEMDGQYRLDWDMDGDEGAAKYIEIWKRVRRIFDQEGVTNAVWVWSPATFRREISPARYYPGDDQVDWIAVDPYLWVPCKVQEYADMTTQVSQAFFDFAAEHPTKPVMLGEWGTPLVPDTTWRADFLASTFEMVDNHPEIVAIVYFDSPTNLPCDWRLMDDPEVLQQYRDFIKDPKYAVDLEAMDLVGSDG